MATKKDTVSPVSENGDKPKLLPGEIILAEGTPFERIHKLKVLRGKKYRSQHLTLLETFGKLGSLANDESDNKLTRIIETIKELFGTDEFEDVLVPFALGMETDEEREYLDQLLPFEKFTAYMEGAGFIVNGSQSPGVSSALKK